MDGANEELVIPKPKKPRQRQNNSRDIKEMKERLEAAKEITKLFNVERYVYISCCGVAVLLLLINAVRLFERSEVDYAGLGLLFGSGGLITYSTGRLIFMWNKILELILMAKTENGEKDDGNK